ncbi:hypothetical protein N7U66_11900 [Lacinutrix neustonica]|uniref:7TM-DISM receptor extracellular domain-containing protein n=1 Tax=Lacinutrix neustonica TaxID=2980107 RepID=A0A9E8MU03_9FLAO|nr:7TM-DISM domain-containing protein [Lacinutrix neustonica]WAC00925.1 hypothetical protein N7U66_11900 [Lacinutrix neustonica]
MRQVLLFFIIFTSFFAVAQNNVYNPLKSKGKLFEYAMFTKAPITDVQELITKQNQLEFQNLSSENQSVGFTSDDYWVTFRLENSASNEKTYYLETARPVTDVAYLYQLQNGKITKFSSGDGIAFEDRQVSHRETVFKVQLPQNTVQKFYLHLKSDGETLNLPLKLYTEEDFTESQL